MSEFIIKGVVVIMFLLAVYAVIIMTVGERNRCVSADDKLHA